LINISAVSANTSVADTGLPGSKIVRHVPNQDVVLTYDVVRDWTGAFRPPAQFHATMLPEYIEFTGDNALIHPKMSAQALATVHFDWTKLPASWILATSFGTTSNSVGRCQSYSGKFGAVEQALFAAGEFRVHRFQIGVRPVILAIRGQWTFSDEEAIANVQKAVGIVRDFWHDDNFPYFLVTLKQFDTDSGQGNGSAFTNAFWLYLSRRDSISDKLWLLIHEAFHGWDPQRMGPPEASSEIAWFAEGFVRYYSYLLAFRARHLSVPDYLDIMNRSLREFSGSTDGGVRGRVIALWLDQRIRRDSGGKSSLDTVMYDMVGDAAKPLTQDRILETAGRYLSPASRTELAHTVEPGYRMPDLEAASGPCVRGSVDEIPTFDLGFDLAASRAAGSVSGVEPGGPAFQAGLRNGQRLSGRLSVHNGQTEEMAIVTVQNSDGQRAIEYYPRGKPVKVMQYHLDQEAFAANAASCQSK
jgi:predicted metalloprotease with PDZ domain